MSNKISNYLESYSLNSQIARIFIHSKTFFKTYRFLKKSQYWSKEKLDAYQLEQLTKLMAHSYKNVPYYKRIFDELGLTPADIKTIEDLQKLPFLTKELARENVNDLKATNYSEHRFEYTSTGGSTGSPLQFYKEKGVWLTRLIGYDKLMMDWAGCSFIDRFVFITGEDEPWKYNFFGKILILSSFCMKEEYMPIFIDKMRKLKPKYIIAYPSAITILAKYMKENKIEGIPSIRTIIPHAETLYDWQEELIKDVFKRRIHSQYGLREQSALGATCECSSYYHMFPQYGVVELVDKRGKPVTKEGETGEIVGTGFHTYFFPFIRYKAGDLGVYTKEKCACGRNYPLLKKIQGRTQEFILTKTNQVIPLTGVYGLVAQYSANVRECQLYQDTAGELVLNIIKNKDYSELDTKKLKKAFEQKFKEDIALSFNFVDEIPRTERGKYKFLVQKLHIEI